ncbi:unnamed protein product [Durusdinium trenchii]|uniref:Uncharacterized protein n=1 Tax=Durusdinium trenchii TaxID=1381693 RepID=A0ABP0T070_9DINO
MAGFGCNGSSTRRADGVHSLRHPGWLQGALGVSATWDMRGCELRAKGTHLHAKLEDHEQRLRRFEICWEYLHVGKNSLTFELLEKQTLSAPKVLGKGFLLFSQLPREVFPQMISRQAVLQDVGLYWGPQQDADGHHSGDPPVPIGGSSGFQSFVSCTCRRESAPCQIHPTRLQTGRIFL